MLLQYWGIENMENSMLVSTGMHKDKPDNHQYHVEVGLRFQEQVYNESRIAMYAHKRLT